MKSKDIDSYKERKKNRKKPPVHTLRTQQMKKRNKLTKNLKSRLTKTLKTKNRTKYKMEIHRKIELKYKSQYN